MKKKIKRTHGLYERQSLWERGYFVSTVGIDELIRIPEDAFPVDAHVQCFAISTGIISGCGKALNEDVEKALRPFLCQIVLEEGWSALELSHAIWFLGNRLCSGCYCSVVPQVFCPSYGHCEGSISTTTYFRRGFGISMPIGIGRVVAAVSFFPNLHRCSFTTPTNTRRCFLSAIQVQYRSYPFRHL